MTAANKGVWHLRRAANRATGIAAVSFRYAGLSYLEFAQRKVAASELETRRKWLGASALALTGLTAGVGAVAAQRLALRSKRLDQTLYGEYHAAYNPVVDMLNKRVAEKKRPSPTTRPKHA